MRLAYYAHPCIGKTEFTSLHMQNKMEKIVCTHTIAYNFKQPSICKRIPLHFPCSVHNNTIIDEMCFFEVLYIVTEIYITDIRFTIH